MKRLLACIAAALMPLAATAQEGAVQGRFTSSVGDLRIAALQVLPAAPAGGSGRDVCEQWLAAPKTAAGRQVQAAGWGVTGEVAAGRYQAVSFVGSFEPGTSGSCLARDGNVGIFEGSSLVAIVYVPRGSDRTIGSIEAFETSGLRIWDGDYLRQPLADLQVAGDGALAIGPLATQEKVCGGKAAVPNIYGKPINDARAMLQDMGWAAVASAAPRQDPREADLVARGVLEVDGCSGTGFGCRPAPR